MTDYWLGIDIGTSGCKVIAIDGRAHVVATSLTEYPRYTQRPGWSEQDPADWWQATCVSVREVTAQLPDPGVVRGIGLCGQMHGLTALDRADAVIRPAILWNDQRNERQCRAIVETVGGPEALLRLTNNQMLPGFTAGKILWLREHEPESFRRMHRFLNPKDFLRLRMTGDHATDVSDASGTGLFDVRRRVWSAGLIAAIDLPERLFPRVVESHEVTGTLLPEVAQDWGVPAGLPVVGGGGDAVLQTTAMGVIGGSRLGITLGTAGIVAGATDECPDNRGGLLQISCGNAADRWHVMGVALNTGGAFHWLRGALAPLAGDCELSYARLVELAEAAPPGARGLLFLPYLLGERCPHVAPDARGAWIGLTPQHGAAELVRSVMEGVLFNMRQIVDLCAAADLGMDEIRVSGGATGERQWLQLLADILNSPVSTVAGGEQGGALGAALLAGIGTGRWKSLHDATGVIGTATTVRPRAETSAVYQDAYQDFCSLFDHLDPLFARQRQKHEEK